MRFLPVFLTLFSVTVALRCYEGTVVGLQNFTRTEETNCGGISNYCIQRINKKTGEMKRECSSWSDEHSMEEKCPVSGCHYQSKDEDFCCCQFDGCNEWKGDGTQLKESEVTKKQSSITKTAPTSPSGSNFNSNQQKAPLPRTTSEVTLD